jgi:hypothetical protein
MLRLMIEEDDDEEEDEAPASKLSKLSKVQMAAAGIKGLLSSRMHVG